MGKLYLTVKFRETICFQYCLPQSFVFVVWRYSFFYLFTWVFGINLVHNRNSTLLFNDPYDILRVWQRLCLIWSVAYQLLKVNPIIWINILQTFSLGGENHLLYLLNFVFLWQGIPMCSEIHLFWKFWLKNRKVCDVVQSGF